MTEKTLFTQNETSIPGWGSTGRLECCPSCDSAGIHLSGVSAFRPGQEGSHTTLDGPSPAFSEVNPSSERAGVAIYLWCDACGGTARLELGNHEGMVTWRLLADADANVER